MNGRITGGDYFTAYQNTDVEDFIKDDAEEINYRPYTDMDDSDDEDYIHIYYLRR